MALLDPFNVLSTAWRKLQQGIPNIHVPLKISLTTFEKSSGLSAPLDVAKKTLQGQGSTVLMLPQAFRLSTAGSIFGSVTLVLSDLVKRTCLLISSLPEAFCVSVSVTYKIPVRSLQSSSTTLSGFTT